MHREPRDRFRQERVVLLPPYVQARAGFLLQGPVGAPGVSEGETAPARGPSQSWLRQRDHGLSLQLWFCPVGIWHHGSLWFSNHMLEDCRGWVLG